MTNRPIQHLIPHTRFYFSHFRMTWISQRFSSIPTLGVSKTNYFSGIILKFGTQMQWLFGLCISQFQAWPSPRATPGDSHILVVPGVGFSLLCLTQGQPPEVLNQSKDSIILKKARFLLCFLNKWVAALFICLYMLEVSSVTLTAFTL